MNSEANSGFTILSVMCVLSLQESTLDGSLIRGALGDCMLLDPDIRIPAVHINYVIWKKGNLLMGNLKGQNATTCKIYSKRCHVFNNGSLSLCPTWVEDIGQYSVDTFAQDGKHIYSHQFQLKITQFKQAGSLISKTPGDCMLFDPAMRKPGIHICFVIWKKGNILIGKIEGQNVSACKIDSERCLLFKNGSLTLCPTWLEDTGQYTVEASSEDGMYQYNETIRLVVTQPEPKSKKTINWPRLYFYVLTGVQVAMFLFVMGSCIYEFGKRRSKTASWETSRLRHGSFRWDRVEYAIVNTRKRDQQNKTRALHEPGAVETTEEGQCSLIRIQEDAPPPPPPPETAPFTSNAIQFMSSFQRGKYPHV